MGNILLLRSAVGVPGNQGSGLTADPYANYTKTYYLDPVNGLDTNNGLTRLTAFQTLAHAVSMLTVGSTRIICIPTGVCVVNATNVNWPANTGTSSSAQVVLQGDPSSGTTLFQIELTGGALLFPNQTSAVNWVVFRKLEIYTNNSIGSPIVGETALIWYGPDFICNGLTVEYCKLHDVYGSDNTGWIFFQGTHSNFIFHYSKWYNCYNSGGTSNHNGGGIFTYQTPNVIVDHNDLSAAGALIYMKRCSPSTGTVNGWTITKNVFRDSPGNDAILVSEQGAADVGGFFGVDVEYNLFFNVGQCIDQNNSENTVQSSGFTFAHNTVAQDVTNALGWRAMQNITTHSNVLMPSGLKLAMLDAASPNGFTNTISLWDYNADMSPTADIWWLDRYGASSKQYTTWASWKTAHSVDNRAELSADPDLHSVGFTSAQLATNFPAYTSRNYTIASGSPLKGIGQGGTDPGYIPTDCGPGW